MLIYQRVNHISYSYGHYCQSCILFAASDPRPSGTLSQRKGIAVQKWDITHQTMQYLDIYGP
jgi:hypothetical protein